MVKLLYHRHHNVSQCHMRGLGVILGNIFESMHTLRVWDPVSLLFSQLWRQNWHRQSRHTYAPPHPNRHPRPLHTTPTPTSPTWKLLKSASMSQQRRRMALSASNDVAGTLKRFFATSTSATYSYTILLHGAINPTNIE